VYDLPLQQHVRRCNTGNLQWCDSEGSIWNMDFDVTWHRFFYVNAM
jgi:hypothetical protein